MEKYSNMKIWKSVENYKNSYEVSTDGDVRRIGNEKMLTPRKHTNGYLRVSLCEGGTVKDFYIHRLVAAAFIENNLNKTDVNHIDGNKQNNMLQNLEWLTRSENQIHAFKTGLNKISDHHKKANAVFNSKQVLDLQTGIYYDSLKEACEFSNKKYANVLNSNYRARVQPRFIYV